MDRLQFAIGEDIALRKRLSTRLGLPAAQGDAMVEKNAAGSQKGIGLLKIDRQHLAADVLEHPYADQLVEGAGHFAVILIGDLAAILQTGLADALRSQLDLFATQGNAQGTNTVLLGRVYH